MAFAGVCTCAIGCGWDWEAGGWLEGTVGGRLMGGCWLIPLDGTRLGDGCWARDGAYGEAWLFALVGDAVWWFCANCWWAGDARACV